MYVGQIDQVVERGDLVYSVSRYPDEHSTTIHYDRTTRCTLPKSHDQTTNVFSVSMRKNKDKIPYEKTTKAFRVSVKRLYLFSNGTNDSWPTMSDNPIRISNNGLTPTSACDVNVKVNVTTLLCACAQNRKR